MHGVCGKATKKAGLKWVTKKNYFMKLLWYLFDFCLIQIWVQLKSFLLQFVDVSSYMKACFLLIMLFGFTQAKGQYIGNTRKSIEIHSLANIGKHFLYFHISCFYISIFSSFLYFYRKHTKSIEIQSLANIRIFFYIFIFHIFIFLYFHLFISL